MERRVGAYSRGDGVQGGRQTSRLIVTALAASFAWAVGVGLPKPATAEAPEISARKAVERKTFTDDEIVDGFFKIAFGAELHAGSGRVDRIRKYDAPIRLYVQNNARPDRRTTIAAIVADIASKVDGLDIAVTSDRKAANVMVRLVRDKHLGTTIRKLYGQSQGRRIMSSLEPQCLSGFRKDGDYRILRSDVILVADAGEFIFYDCAYEEVLQALGPINDDSSVPWTMFNDDIQMGFFDVYDQYLLNILYHPKIRAGMTREEVKSLLPEILPEVRAFVARNNGLSSR